MIKKGYYIFIIAFGLIFSKNSIDAIKELTYEKIKNDLEKCNQCWDTELFSISDILKNCQHQPLKDNLSTVGPYYLLHVKIPDSYSGCTFNDSPILLYSNNGDNLKFIKVLSGGYKFEQLNGSRYFISDISCTSMNSEVTSSFIIKEFKNESLIDLISLGGYDRYLYYLSLYQKGSANKEGVSGFEDYKTELSKFNSAIGDTITDFSKCTDFKMENGNLKSCTIERRVRLLKGANSDFESLKTKDYITKELKKF